MNTHADEAPLMLSVSGLRGITGKSLTEAVAGRFAAAFAAHLRERRGIPVPAIVFGRDGRAGGIPHARAAIEALLASGCRVIDLGVAMTPTVGVVVDHLHASAGLILTASHNPAEWNGLKCLVTSPTPRGAMAHAPDAAEAAQIIARFQSTPDAPAYRERAGPESFKGAAKLHAERAIAAIGPHAAEAVRASRFRVVVDSVNCSGAEGARALLEALHCDLTHLGADPGGIFPHPPEPTRENLAGMSEIVTREHCHVGFAQDPDADRLAILDERGAYIGEEYTLVFAAMAAGAKGDAFAANLSTSRMLDDVAARLQGSVARTPVGEANVVAGMLARGCAIGGEGNGGVIWPPVTLIRDSLSAMALTLALMARERATVSALVASTPAYVIEKRKAPIKPGLADKASRAIAAANRPHAVDTQDGVRVDFAPTASEGAAWLHVRASNTEPIMRLIAEAPTAARARHILDDAAAILARA